MRHVLRAALAGALLLVPAVPAHAAGAVVLTCDVHFDGGTPVGSGTGTCNVHGLVGTTLQTFGPAGMVFDYLPGTCGVARAVAGVMFGAVNVDFQWSSMVADGFITTSGDINGFGQTQQVQVTGHPCGGPETWAVVMEIVGT
jgi:hypothetical protein